MASITGTGILTTILNVVAESLLIPVLILLIIFMLLVLTEVGGLLAEYSRRTKLSDEELDLLINNISDSKNSEEVIGVINNCNLNTTYKDILVKVANTSHLKVNVRESYISKIIGNQEYQLGKTLRRTDIISRVGSGCGLLGTLIPLGPGLASLGTGDIATLSSQLIVAFNTTTVGLSVSLVSYVISKIRTAWYKDDIDTLYTISEAIVGVDND